MSTYILKILRGSPEKQYWEEFELERNPFANVISGLMEIQRNPVNRKGEDVEPVAWEQGCLEEVCGSCSMLINGKPRQSCTALIENYIKQTGSNIITLAPLSKFPLVRDLMCDRTQMFDNLKKVSAWIEVDTTCDLGPGPKISQEKQEIMYSLSTCMTCGCCSESCPNVSDKTSFMGPAPLSQVRLMNAHPTGAMHKDVRLSSVMEKGGITGCGNSQNCARVCPKNIPLTESIAEIGKQTTRKAIKDLFTP